MILRMFVESDLHQPENKQTSKPINKGYLRKHFISYIL